MNKMMRKITAVSAIALVAVGVAGCSTYYTQEEAKAIPFAVLETENATLWEGSEFSYADSEGTLHELSNCSRDDLFSQRHCDSADGVVSFAYSVYRGGGIGSASITVDGVKEDMECSPNADDSWNGLYICVPVSSAKSE